MLSIITAFVLLIIAIPILLIGAATIYCSKKEKKTITALAGGPYKVCPPVETKQATPVRKVIEPVAPVRISLQDWVKGKADYMIRFLDDKSKEEMFISNDMIGMADALEIETWLLGQLRVANVQRTPTGLMVALENPDF